MTRLALCYLDAAGRPWFLHREAGLGNLMRTPDPLSARCWDQLCEIEAWAAKLPEKAKEQLRGHALHVVPIEASVGSPIFTFRLMRLFNPAEGESDTVPLIMEIDSASLTLSPDPAPSGRRRRAVH